MMMTFATELVRFHDQAAADDEAANPARIKGLRASTEALREAMLVLIEPDWQVEEAFGRLQDAAAAYSRSAPAHPAREARFAAFNAALAAFAAALDGAEADRAQVARAADFCAEQVPNPLADLR